MEDYIYKKVSAITFGILSPMVIKKMSFAKIVTPELYDKEGYPVDGGLMDVRLGVIDPGLRCKTCNGKLKECPGHFGYIELARPVVHVNYGKVILDTLRSICRDCSRALLTQDKIEAYIEELKKLEIEEGLDVKRAKVKEIQDSLKNIKKCPHCAGKQYKVVIEKPTTYIENDKRLSPVDIKTRFEKIPDQDLLVIGINPDYARPEWTLLTMLPIPPVTMRPSITLETGERSEDDLTHKLGDIVRINQRLFENINAGAPEIIVEDLWDLLQYHVTTYFDNSITQIPPARHRGGQPLKTLTERIKSKEGRFRHNLAGKRVNYAARTVISPDPKIAFNEVGVPKIVAMELTVPERVTEWNMDWLKDFIKKGPKEYPGANYVIRPDGKKKKITDDTREQLLTELQPGYIVERHLLDNDISVFNRQPSLHRMSIMGHRIKVLPGRSFRLNPSVCVAPDTLVQLGSGVQRKIDDLKNCWKESELLTYDFTNKNIEKTELKRFFGLKPEAYGTRCYEITTNETNRKIVATADHPFYTSNGVKSLEEIKKNDKVVVRPVDTPLYKDVDKEILRKTDIIKSSPKETYLKHTLKVLEDLRLIPLNLLDQRTMILSRLIGHIYGDGTFILKKDSSRLIFRGKEKDLKDIQNDILSLGFKPEKIYVKTFTGEILTVKGKKLNVKGRGADFEIRSKPLGILFKALGAPNGDKTGLRYGVPRWIKEASLHIKREFLAAYFGSELTKPAVRQTSKTNFRSLTFKLSKINENDAYKFIKDIRELLRELDVEIGHISKEPGNIRKDGSKTTVVAVNITSNKSIINLLGKIGYLYNSQADNLARLCYQYLKIKELHKNNRINDYKQLHMLRKRGVPFKEISRMLGMSVPMLENWMYRNKNAGIESAFIGFSEWIKESTTRLPDGLVWETVSKKSDAYCPFVYDVTTISDNHNFFANGFLTKNCNPYNADFDGDEMNLHIPQYEEARSEAEILMQVQTQIITPKNGLNVIGCIEDAVSGNYLLTKELSFPRDEAAGILMAVGLDDIPHFTKDKVDGKEIFSALLPNDFNFITSSESKYHHDPIIIRDGKLVSGIIDKGTIGGDNGTLIRALYAAYDEDRAIDILGKIFRLGIEILFRVGFTTKISDNDMSKEVEQKCEEIIKEAYRKVDEFIEMYRKGQLETLPSKTLRQTLEIKILGVLNKVRNEIGKLIAAQNYKDNYTIIMIKSGATGNILNLAQMASTVGQQALRGKRIEGGYSNRTLSSFKEHDLSPKARGFIKNGYKQGLSPVEFFFGAMTGRDSLMDTALRTPKSGYLYRRLANALQDLKIEYDKTVRDANKTIVQFSYGDDDVDVSKSEGGSINIKKIIKNVVGEKADKND